MALGGRYIGHMGSGLHEMRVSRPIGATYRHAHVHGPFFDSELSMQHHLDRTVARMNGDINACIPTPLLAAVTAMRPESVGL